MAVRYNIKPGWFKKSVTTFIALLAIIFTATAPDFTSIFLSFTPSAEFI